MAIPACGDGHPRVRRWQIPRAAFEAPAQERLFLRFSRHIPLYFKGKAVLLHGNSNLML
jgi:hypothetical protein